VRGSRSRRSNAIGARPRRCPGSDASCSEAACPGRLSHSGPVAASVVLRLAQCDTCQHGAEPTFTGEREVMRAIIQSREVATRGGCGAAPHTPCTKGAYTARSAHRCGASREPREMAIEMLRLSGARNSTGRHQLVTPARQREAALGGAQHDAVNVGPTRFELHFGAETRVRLQDERP